MAVNYMSDPTVRRCYDAWTRTPTLLLDPEDRKGLYRFVKACADYAAAHGLSKNLDRRHLEACLYRSIVPKYTNDDGFDRIKDKVLANVQLLLEYEATVYPNGHK